HGNRHSATSSMKKHAPITGGSIGTKMSRNVSVAPVTVRVTETCVHPVNDSGTIVPRLLPTSTPVSHSRTITPPLLGMIAPAAARTQASPMYVSPSIGDMTASSGESSSVHELALVQQT